jgi:hypothetical protein
MQKFEKKRGCGKSIVEVVENKGANLQGWLQDNVGTLSFDEGRGAALPPAFVSVDSKGLSVCVSRLESTVGSGS